MDILGGYCTSTDSGNGFLFAVKDKAIEDKATNEYFTVYQFGVSNDTSGLNLVNTQEGITMNHDSARIGWEVAGRNLNYWGAIKFAYKAATNELVGAAHEILRDWVYLAVRPRGWPEMPVAPVRRLVQRVSHWKGCRGA